MIKIAPSILSANLAKLDTQIKSIVDGGADWIHIDVMDGQFVPNLTFGTPIVKAVNELTNLPLDVHLMVNEPDHLIPSFVKAGADIITVQIEAVKHLHRSVSLIKEHGAKAGVAVNPGTPANSLEAILDEIDMILVMSVNPGFGGQSFINSSLVKISQISQMIKASKKDILLEVDGGVNNSTAPLIAKAGANVFVAGSAVFNSDNIGRAIKELKLI